MKRKIEFDKECCDFMKLSKSEPQPQKRMRMLALGHLKNGMKITKASKSVGVDRHTVGIWYDAFKAHGLAGLDDKPKSGRPPKLKRTKEQDFLKEVENLQSARSGGRVTGYDIQKMAKSSFDADYAEDSIYTVLKRLDFSWITARSKHPKSNKDAQEAFKKTSNKKLSKLSQGELI
jgi:transposase